MNHHPLKDLIADVLAIAEGHEPDSSPQAAAMLQDLLAAPDRSGPPLLSTAELVEFVSGGVLASDIPRLHAAFLADPDLLDEALMLIENIELVRAESDAVEAPEEQPTLTRDDLSEFLSGRRTLTADEQRQLFRDAGLRATFSELKREHAALLPGEATTQGRAFVMPSLAAAATNREVEQRNFPGGAARIAPSQRGDRVYINFTFDYPESVPAHFQIEREDRVSQTFETAVVELTRMPGKSGVQLVLPADDVLVRLLRAPDATGMFLRE